MFIRVYPFLLCLQPHFLHIQSPVIICSASLNMRRCANPTSLKHTSWGKNHLSPMFIRVSPLLLCLHPHFCIFSRPLWRNNIQARNNFPGHKIFQSPLCGCNLGQTCILKRDPLVNIENGMFLQNFMPMTSKQGVRDPTFIKNLSYIEYKRTNLSKSLVKGIAELKII